MLLCVVTVLKPKEFVSFQAKVTRGGRRRLCAPKSRAAQSVSNQEQTPPMRFPKNAVVFWRELVLNVLKYR